MDPQKKLEEIASLAHRAANGGLDTAGRKAGIGVYKALLREIRDLANA